VRRLIIRLAALTAAGSLALAELGSGWTFSVNGYVQERPLAAEQGTPREIEAAQARNRRVEVTVTP